MKRFAKKYSCVLAAWMLAVLIVTFAAPAAAQNIQATVGSQSTDMGRQALAFLPNELWVHVGTSVTWTFPTNEIHTVTFLKPGQTRPAFPVGCPGTTPSGSGVMDTVCVNSGTLIGGQTYTVQFPAAGNFKLVCLVHTDMTGVVHVLNLAEPLPHDQAFLNRQAQDNRSDLLSDASRLQGRGTETAERTSKNEVTAGISEIVATGGGVQTSSVMRFMRDKIEVRVGDTVEWTNSAPNVPHTVTFGAEPANPQAPPSVGVTTDADGALHAVISSPTDSVHSGLLREAPQERVGLAQSPSGPTRFRVTFRAPGTFNYICVLHDDLGMKGTVVVRP